MPKLLPITGTFAPFFASYFSLLSWRVVSQRLQTNKHLGTSETAAGGPDDLTVASRCHANFVENVPFALLLGVIVELNGGNRKILSGGLSALLAFRILHAEFGLRAKNATGFGRGIGHAGTISYLLGFAGYAGYLVKGYWGL